MKKKVLLLIILIGLLMAVKKNRMDIVQKINLTQMEANLLIRNKYSMILDKVYWTMPGKVSMPPYSHMGRPVRANLGLSLGMEQIKELSPNCVNNFSKALLKTEIKKAVLSKSNFPCWKFTMRWLLIYLMQKILERRNKVD